MNHELFEYTQIPDFQKSINFDKITKQGVAELLEDWYKNFELLDPYLKSIFTVENEHIQNLLSIARYQGQYVSEDYILNYLNINNLRNDT